MALEMLIRLGGFGGVLLLMLVWESLKPLRRDERRWRRRSVNLGIVVLDTAILRLSVPLLATGAAVIAQEHSIGLLNRLSLPYYLSMGIALLLLDLTIYWQHRLFHRVKPLWRVHAMHHSDLAMDTTTGLRFHPLEIIVSMLIKIAVVLLLGVPWLAVVVFEVALNAMALFNHSNVTLPARLERLLRRVAVTPDMHRVHHSVRADEHHCNFGFNLSLWDRLFGSYKAQPQGGHLDMEIGLAQYRGAQDQHLPALILQPFRRGESPE